MCCLGLRIDLHLDFLAELRFKVIRSQVYSCHAKYKNVSDLLPTSFLHSFPFFVDVFKIALNVFIFWRGWRQRGELQVDNLVCLDATSTSIKHNSK